MQIIAVILAIVLMLAGGSTTLLLAGDGLMSFAAGFLFRGLFAETTCYVNGQLVDCSQVPQNVLSAGG